MEDNKNTVPYLVHEGAMVRMERSQRRLWILCIIIFAVLVITNAGWLWYESQFEDVVTTTHEITQDIDTGDGDAVVAGIGDAYGENKADG